jgi:hypothetical protein
VDVLEMIKAKELEVVDKENKEVTADFLQLFELYKKERAFSSPGICWRWLVGCRGDGVEVKLMVQALPCSLELIKSSPVLRQDHSRGIVIDERDIHHEQFADIPGPVPTFFSEDPKKTRQELLSSPEYAYNCLQALAARLLRTNEITR